MAQEMRRTIEPGHPDGFSTCILRCAEMMVCGAITIISSRYQVHHAHRGDENWTVKCGTQRILDVHTLRTLCEYIGDTFADDHIHFTIRSNVEYVVDSEDKVQPLIDAIEEAGFIVVGTANPVATLSHTQGWLHCDIPGTDASGVVKSMMDELITQFKECNMPNRVHITTSCCRINCGGQGDIAINVQHTRPPRIDHDSSW